MRLSLVLIIINLLSLSATVYSQATHLSLNLKDATFEQIFKEIEQQSNFTFLYKTDLMDSQKRINIKISDSTVENVLDNIFKDSDVGYRILENNLVILMEKDSELLKTFQQNITITGTVTDEAGEPMPGVNVMIKGTSTGVVTDISGKYHISVLNRDAVLVFSFMGYTAQELAVGNRVSIDVMMEEDAREIEEVVVVGYGTQKKVNLTGAVGIASAERLENRTITSLGQGLQGVIPGLNITYTSGNPTQGADFNIRGFESINGGSPLILVDGVPMNVERINTNDIKSVSVLKDASSAAVYGARAAFGVILVETKKGTPGKANISFSAQFTFQKHIFPGWEPYGVREGGTTRQVFNQANIATSGRKSNSIPEAVELAALAYQEMKNPTPEDAWMYYNGYLYTLENTYMKDLAFRDYSPQQQYGVNVSGSSERASYYVSFGAIHKEGFFKYGNEDYKRYNVLSKVDFKINDWISLEEKVSFYSEMIDNPHDYGSQWYYQSICKNFYSPHTFPDLTYYKEPGDREKYEHLIGMHGESRNPLAFLKNGGRNTTTNNDIWLTQGITITPPVKGLTIRGDFSYNYNWRDAEQVRSQVEVLRGGVIGFQLVDDIIHYGESANDWIQGSLTKNTYYVLNALAEYSREDWGNHRFKVMAGFNQEYGNWHTVTARTTTLLAPNIHSLSAATGTKTNDDSKNELMLRGLFYRLNYSYKDRYLFEANGRYDGTSRFPNKDRFGFFPSFSVGWRLSEEKFMAGTKTWLDNLKIRASYGELGNQNVGSYYPYITTMPKGISYFLFDGGGNLSDYINPGGLVSSTLTWEKVVSKNIGLDFIMFKGKLDTSFDLFIRDTKDMLMYKEYPGVLGADAPAENAADLKNAGWELAISWRDNISKNWSYQINFSLSDYQTEITKYDNPTGAINEYYVGKKVNEIWGYKTLGLIQTEEELAEVVVSQAERGSNWKLGDVHWADLDGDGKITPGSNTLDDPGDRIRIGNSTPRYAFGINPVIRYKNFSLDIFFQGIMKRDWYPSTSNFLRFFPFKTPVVERWCVEDSWSPENRDAYFPGIQYTYSDGKNTAAQTRYLQNAAYIRLKNVTLSYRIPVKFVSEAQIYLNGTNLWEASGMYKTLDPEYPSDLTPRYMFHRSFTIGLRASF